MGIKSNNISAAFHDFFSRSGKDAVNPYVPPPDLIEGFDIMLVAGGGSGGGSVGGGGGAGGIIYAASVSLASGAYVMNVGAGANQTPQGSNAGTNGADTTFGISGTAYLTALGGGGGASGAPGGAAGAYAARDGGSGGGGSYHSQGGNNGTAGTGSQPNTWSGPSEGSVGATITGYGNPGGSVPSPSNMGGGGGAGGAGSVPSNANNTAPSAPSSGAGQPFPIVSGSNFPSTPGIYGVGGEATDQNVNGDAGAANTGQGGQGGWNFGSGRGGAGGSGVAFLIVPNTNAPLITTPAPSSPAGDSSSRTVFKFTSTGPTSITIS